MKKLPVFLAALLSAAPAFASDSTVVCYGTADSGAQVSVTLTFNVERASPNGTLSISGESIPFNVEADEKAVDTELGAAYHISAQYGQAGLQFAAQTRPGSETQGVGSIDLKDGSHAGRMSCTFTLSHEE